MTQIAAVPARADGLPVQSNGQVRSPSVLGIDPLALEADHVHALAFRAGLDLGELNVSAFVTNALNQAPRLSRVRDLPTTTLFYETSVRPRTIGLTIILQR